MVVSRIDADETKEEGKLRGRGRSDRVCSARLDTLSRPVTGKGANATKRASPAAARGDTVTD